MVRIVFETAGGQQFPIVVEASGSLMQAATGHGVPGIDADCGGSMVCGTCHVYIASEWQAKLPPKSDMEIQILEYVPSPHPDARLSCQIPLGEQLDGLIAVLPPAQR